MINQDLLDILRCPLDASHGRGSHQPSPAGSMAHKLVRIPPGERSPEVSRPESAAESSGTRLSLEGDALYCQRCRLKFAIKGGIPNMIVEEAELPPGCDSISQLPCQLEAKAAKRS
ncbi:MAG TPA: Trm112 family protein, partial [Gemmataceae bacterium]|nr:Trm112 family protein [Gemmataceae bacterium]